MPDWKQKGKWYLENGEYTISKIKQGEYYRYILWKYGKTRWDSSTIIEAFDKLEDAKECHRKLKSKSN